MLLDYLSPRQPSSSTSAPKQTSSTATPSREESEETVQSGSGSSPDTSSQQIATGTTSVDPKNTDDGTYTSGSNQPSSKPSGTASSTTDNETSSKGNAVSSQAAGTQTSKTFESSTGSTPDGAGSNGSASKLTPLIREDGDAATGDYLADFLAQLEGIRQTFASNTSAGDASRKASADALLKEKLMREVFDRLSSPTQGFDLLGKISRASDDIHPTDRLKNLVTKQGNMDEQTSYYLKLYQAA